MQSLFLTTFYISPGYLAVKHEFSFLRKPNGIMKAMDACRHRNLLLVTPPKDRIRCRHCHLTLKRDELKNGYCPECYAATGVKRFDFDEVAATPSDKVQYRCEDCNITWFC